ncbi:MAG TPA: DUF3073 family protein [Mycobacteriales bacterium]|nr:DUF3073 family protein [Mycobacteriales bacterium]
MGRRGRAKAKHTKVARELKYSSYEPDLDKLQQELAAGDQSSHRRDDDDDEDTEHAPWERSSH